MIKSSHTHQRRRGRLSSAAFSGPACGGAADGGGAGTAGEGAVVAAESALGAHGSSLWVMDLDDSGALRLSHWEPAA